MPCGSLTTNYTIPEGTKTIGIHAFYGSKNLQELTVASSVTSTNGVPSPIAPTWSG